VIGVPVRAIGTERDDDRRADSPDVAGNIRDDLTRIGAVDELVAVAEHGNVVHTEDGRGGAKLRLAHDAECRWAGMSGITGSSRAKPSAIAACGRDQRRRHALGCVPRQCAAETQRLIVRVCEHGHETAHPSLPP